MPWSRGGSRAIGPRRSRASSAPLGRRLAGRFGVGAAARLCRLATDRRITSYNVCYTKLLRFLVAVTESTGSDRPCDTKILGVPTTGSFARTNPGE